MFFLVHQLQASVVSSSLTRLYNFVNEDQEKDLSLRINIQEYLNNKSSGRKSKSKKNDSLTFSILIANCLLSSIDYFVSSPTESLQYLTTIFSNHRFNPLLITFHLKSHTLNTTYPLFHILFTNDNETTKEHFSDIFMSLALSFSSNRQKQSFHISKYVLLMMLIC